MSDITHLAVRNTEVGEGTNSQGAVQVPMDYHTNSQISSSTAQTQRNSPSRIDTRRQRRTPNSRKQRRVLGHDPGARQERRDGGVICRREVGTAFDGGGGALGGGNGGDVAFEERRVGERALQAACVRVGGGEQDYHSEKWVDEHGGELI